MNSGSALTASGTMNIGFALSGMAERRVHDLVTYVPPFGPLGAQPPA